MSMFGAVHRLSDPDRAELLNYVVTELDSAERAYAEWHAKI